MQKFKIVVTGGSGFIGSNLIELLKDDYNLISYDISKPKISDHNIYWKNVDILNKEDLFKNLLTDDPDYLVHLAARTDLDESSDLKKYDVNISGVRNLMDAASQLKNLRRTIIASSMLVCKLGYNPISFDDYDPNSLYGESKVLTEKIVKEYDLDWTLVRPTSIWGPWFEQPYKNFFELVIKGFYFNIPEKFASTKTYGYVENTCMQIIKLLISHDLSIKHNYFYLGDIHPINIADWANRIRKLNNQSKTLTLPKWILKAAAKFGDFIKFNFGYNKFPMNMYRYKNMTNNNIIIDLKRTIDVTEIGANYNLDHQILKTLNWFKQIKNKK